MTQTTGAIPWSTVVTQVKNYAKANDNIGTAAWNSCTDPYALSYKDEARIYKKLVYGAPAFRNIHLDPHVLHLAAVFAILTRESKTEREGLDLPKKVRLFAG